MQRGLHDQLLVHVAVQQCALDAGLHVLRSVRGIGAGGRAHRGRYTGEVLFNQHRVGQAGGVMGQIAIVKTQGGAQQAQAARIVGGHGGDVQTGRGGDALQYLGRCENRWQGQPGQAAQKGGFVLRKGRLRDGRGTQEQCQMGFGDTGHLQQAIHTGLGIQVQRWVVEKPLAAGVGIAALRCQRPGRLGGFQAGDFVPLPSEGAGRAFADDAAQHALGRGAEQKAGGTGQFQCQ